MSLYNILHGRNPLAEFYLAILELGAVGIIEEITGDKKPR